MASEIKVDSEAIQKAVVGTLAAEIFQKIQPEDRDRTLTDAIAAALKYYDLRKAVSLAVRVRAGELAAAMCASPEWTEKIAAAVQAGIEDGLLETRRRAAEAFRR